MRILFVAMASSVHTARWIDLVSDQDWELYLYSSNSYRIHPDFRNLTIYNFSFARPEGLHQSVRVRGLWPFRKGAASPVFFPELTFRWSSRALAELIRRIKPDIVHTLEIQQAGYLALAARAILKDRFPPWIVSNWGSDIHLFGRLSEHAERIRSVLAACDYYACECHRDVKLARTFGFKGEVLPVLPNTGGFDMKHARRLRQPGPTSSRRLIALKGYQHWAGRALVGLRAIELCADVLEDYRVAIYSATPEVKLAAELVAGATGIPIDLVPAGSHADILRLHGRARASIGLSITDALSTSALEAILMGSFPIQSDTSCLGEWIRDGDTGILVPPEDPHVVAAAIRRAVIDDGLVDRAASENTRLTTERLDQSKIRPQVIASYEKILAQSERKAHLSRSPHSKQRTG